MLRIIQHYAGFQRTGGGFEVGKQFADGSLKRYTGQLPVVAVTLLPSRSRLAWLCG